MRRIKGTKYVCTIPKELGKVTKITVVTTGRVLVDTESGIQMIIPYPEAKP